MLAHLLSALFVLIYNSYIILNFKKKILTIYYIYIYIINKYIYIYIYSLTISCITNIYNIQIYSSTICKDNSYQTM